MLPVGLKCWLCRSRKKNVKSQRSRSLSNSRNVIEELFAAMRASVRSYGAGAIEVKKEIDGTAFFPGGSGLWRGLEPYGKLPEEFPESPVMLKFELSKI